jgi:uncharacterized protein YecT (DUF1311 family)
MGQRFGRLADARLTRVPGHTERLVAPKDNAELKPMMLWRPRMVSVVTVLIVLGPAPVAHTDESCLGQSTAPSIRDCLVGAEAKAEEALRVVLIQADASADQARRALIDASQSAWSSFRNKECALQADASRGGTLQPDQYALCLIAKDQERTRELAKDAGLATH